MNGISGGDEFEAMGSNGVAAIVRDELGLAS
jgi:hypothetical protein